jgi:hypothetical protein
MSIQDKMECEKGILVICSFWHILEHTMISSFLIDCFLKYE